MRVGVDIVEVEDVSRASAALGRRYLERVFTPHELSCAKGSETVRAGHLAARFAAKEATFKILGAGDELPPWRSIEVVREDSGRTSLRLYGRAEELALAAGVSELAVSLTHEGPIAAAVIVAREGEAMW